MGCDGGTIPKRDELVRTKKKKEQKDRNSERMYRWKFCSVSQTPLRSPIVACELGRLYNKEEVLTRLLNKTQAESNIEHIRGLKDIKELNLTENPSYDASKDNENGGESIENTRSAWICPVTSLEMNGKHSFVFMWKCGCVLSSRAVNEVKSDTCFKCGSSVVQNDVILLNAQGDDLQNLNRLMADRRAKAKLEKKLKRKLGAEGEAVEPPVKREKGEKTSKASSKVSKPSTSVSGMASSILRDSEFSSIRDQKFSVANNPEHSEVYKSIFDTHESAKKKLKSHWVTCNPLYY